MRAYNLIFMACNIIFYIYDSFHSFWMLMKMLMRSIMHDLYFIIDLFCLTLFEILAKILLLSSMLVIIIIKIAITIVTYVEDLRIFSIFRDAQHTYMVYLLRLTLLTEHCSWMSLDKICVSNKTITYYSHTF